MQLKTRFLTTKHKWGRRWESKPNEKAGIQVTIKFLYRVKNGGKYPPKVKPEYSPRKN